MLTINNIKMKTNNPILREILKVLKANRAYRKALKYTEFYGTDIRYFDTFDSWFEWRLTSEGFEYWEKINTKIEPRLNKLVESVEFRLSVYEYLLEIFGTEYLGDRRFGFCAQLGSIDIENMPELYMQSPSYYFRYWFPLVKGKDENRCNALLEAIKLVKLEIESSKTLSTPE